VGKARGRGKARVMTTDRPAGMTTGEDGSRVVAGKSALLIDAQQTDLMTDDLSIDSRKGGNSQVMVGDLATDLMIDGLQRVGQWIEGSMTGVQLLTGTVSGALQIGQLTMTVGQRRGLTTGEHQWTGDLMTGERLQTGGLMIGDPP